MSGDIVILILASVIAVVNTLNLVLLILRERGRW